MIKIFFLGLICLISANVKAEEMNLKIEIPEDYTGKVSLMLNDAGEEVFLQPSFANLTYTLKKEIHGKYAALIFIYSDGLHNFAQQFVISNSSVSIKFSNKFITHANFKKVTMEDVFIFENTKCWKGIKQYLGSTLDSLRYYSNIYKYVNDSLNTLNYNRQIEITDLKLLGFFEKNKNSFLDFWYFRSEVVASLGKKYAFKLHSIFSSSFSKKIQESYEGKVVAQHLLGLMSEKKGQLAPDFKLKDINGKLISLDKLRGKFVLLSLWATWCSPCIEKIPKLQSLFESYKNKNIEFVAISYDQNLNDLKNGLQKYDMPWTHIFSENNVRYLYGANVLPALYLIDKNGVIQYSLRENDFETLEKILESSLNH